MILDFQKFTIALNRLSVHLNHKFLKNWNTPYQLANQTIAVVQNSKIGLEEEILIIS